MAKAQQEGLAGGEQQGPTEKDAAEVQIKKQLADAKMMETKLKAAAIQSNMQKDIRDSEVKEQEMLAKERIQMIDLAQNLAVHPESEDEVIRLLGSVIPAITGNNPQ
jgi:hypothetical protein